MRPIPATRLGDAHGLMRAIDQRGRLRTDEFVTEFSLDELFPPELENALGRMRHFISYARAAGLVKEDRGVVELTDIGRRYVRAGDAAKPYDISEQQSEWLRRQLREKHMTDSIYHGLAIGLSLLASLAPGMHVSTLDFGRAMAYLGRAGWDNENTFQIQGERHLRLLSDIGLVDDDRRLTPRGDEVRSELTLPVHMSLLDIAAQLNPGGREAVRAEAEAELGSKQPPPPPPPVAEAAPVPEADDEDDEDGYHTALGLGAAPPPGQSADLPHEPSVPPPVGTPDHSAPAAVAPGGGVEGGAPAGVAPGGGASHAPPGVAPGGGVEGGAPPGVAPGGGVEGGAPAGAAPGVGAAQGAPGGGVEGGAPVGVAPAGDASQTPRGAEPAGGAAQAPPGVVPAGGVEGGYGPPSGFVEGASQAPPAGVAPGGASPVPPAGAAPPAGFQSGPPAGGAAPAGFEGAAAGAGPAAGFQGGPPAGAAPTGFEGGAGVAPPAGFGGAAGVAPPAGFGGAAGVAPPGGFGGAAGVAPPAGASVAGGVGAPQAPGGFVAGPSPAGPAAALGGVPGGFLDGGAIRAAAEQAGLQLPVGVYANVAAGLTAGKHLLLTGAPGSGKTTLALVIARAAAQAGRAHGATLVAGRRHMNELDATGDRDGLLVDAARRTRWIVFDELDRARPDRSLGALSAFLAGLPVLLPSGEEVAAPREWRIVATWGAGAPKASAAVMRHFAIVELGPPPADRLRAVLYEAAGRDPVAFAAAERLVALAGDLPLGAGVFLDAARHAAARNATAPAGEATLAREAYTAYIAALLDEDDETGRHRFGELFGA